MTKNMKVKNGEERRVESITKRQNELDERRRLINQSLSGELKRNKRVRFADSDEDEPNNENKPFSFLASIGRIYPEQDAKGVKNGAESSSGISKLINGSGEGTSKLKNQLLMSENRPIFLYKPPNGDGAQRHCFFVDEHTPEIRSSFASFRRHQKEETLRKEWEKLRAPVIKFYKKERKSALRHLRKGVEKERTRQNGQSADG